MFFVEGAPISWSSKKEEVIVLSTYKAKYIVNVMFACQVALLDKLLIELNHKHDVRMKLFINNKSSINLSKNP